MGYDRITKNLIYFQILGIYSFAGISIFLLLVFLGGTLRAQENPKPIRLIACDSSRVDIQMTDYRIHYDRSTTNGFLLIFPESDSTCALATAFLPESSFHLLQPQILQSIAASDSEDSLVVTFVSRKSWAKFTTQLIFYKRHPGLIHWITSILLLDWHQISSFDRDVKFYKMNPASDLQPAVTKYADQDGYAAGLTYFYEKNFIKSTVFYFQDFSPLNAYFQWIHASPRNTVASSAQDFGYALPTSTANLKKGNRYTLTSAYLVLKPGEPSSENDMARRFLEGLSAIYRHIEKPVLETHNWETLASHTLQDLASSKCWVTINDQDFLRSYVDIPRLNSAELIAQLDVLVGMTAYEKSTGISSPLKQKLEGNLMFFYNAAHQQIVNDYPNQGISRGDSWYTIELAIGLSRLAKMGSSVADNLLSASIQSIIHFARTVNYNFPVFFSYDTFQPISGLEPDVAGGYAYLMLNCYDLKKDSLYLEEAKKSIVHIKGKGLDLSYELQMTAATAVACARLYRITGDSLYLSLSYLPLANMLRHTWLWECNYGVARQYSTFFGLSPMPHADVITMKEQYETWEYIRKYVSIVETDVPQDIREILQGFIRYTPNVLYYSLPPNLPDGALWKTTAAYGSLNDNSLYIPYEDLRDGWQQSGQIGQEIYGAGGVFALAAVLKTTVEKQSANETPVSFALLQNYPNPFWGQTTIRVEGARWANRSSKVIRLQIYNALGQVVRDFVKSDSVPGGTVFHWNGKNDNGKGVPAGVYFAILKSGKTIAVKKMVLLR